MGYLSPTQELNALRVNEVRIDSLPAQAMPPSGVATKLGSGMLIVGTVVSTGPVNVSGRVIGDIHAAQLTICEGGRVDGNVIAPDAVILGAFKGTLFGGSVRLQGNAAVDGEVHNRSLTVEPNAIFEGVARRLTRPVEAPTMDDIKVRKPVAPRVHPPLDAEQEPLDLAAENIVSPPVGIDDDVLG